MSALLLWRGSPFGSKSCSCHLRTFSLFSVKQPPELPVKSIREARPPSLLFMGERKVDLAEQYSSEQMWLPVIGRALAQICMHNADMTKRTIAEKARFLQALGLEIQDVADMLGTTSGSVRELLRLAKKKAKRRGPKKNAQKTKGR